MRDWNSWDVQTLDKVYDSKPPKRRKLHIAAVVFLAIVCVGGVELLACRHFEPEIYEAITTPVRLAAQAAFDGACRAGNAAVRLAGEAAAAVSEQVETAAAALSEQIGEVRDSFRAWKEERSAGPPPPEEDSILAQPEETPPKEVLDPLITDLIERNGQEILTGGGVDVVYYNQTDEDRSEQKYGSDPLATHGCGPTAMAMAVETLTGEAADPADMARLCVKQGYWCKSHGSYLSIVQGIAGTYGMRCEPIDLNDLDEDELYQRLSMGEIAVALMTKGHFTKGGHFILLRGVTLSGEILVADPASRDRSLIPWDLSLILDELSPSRHNGAPLWMLSYSGES